MVEALKPNGNTMSMASFVQFKPNLYPDFLLPPFNMSGAQLRSFAPGPTHQGCSGGRVVGNVCVI